MTMDFGAMMGALPAIAEAIPAVVEQAQGATDSLARIADALEAIARNTAILADAVYKVDTVRPSGADYSDEPSSGLNVLRPAVDPANVEAAEDQPYIDALTDAAFNNSNPE